VRVGHRADGSPTRNSGSNNHAGNAGNTGNTSAVPQRAISGISGISDNKGKSGFPIDLNRWHHAIHLVTGDMAVRFNGASAADLKRWPKMLRDIADKMESADSAGRVA